MFGNNTVTSTWGTPQQNQQQQPTGGSVFGQPSNAFGNTAGTFGSAGAFGQPQQPQQPQANPMFGNLGGANTSTAGTSGFGAFGGGNPQASNNSVFGAPKPSTGFGAFGGNTNTGSFGGGGTFGSTGASAFGQPSTTNTGGAFGSTGSVFGQNKPATTGFGTTTATTNNGTFDGVPPVTTGTSNPPYNVFQDKDPTTTGTTMLQYQAISCMPAYRGTSFEELRLQDYAQGRKTAGAFGQSAAFGGATAQPTNSIFGATPAQPAATNSIFGGGAANTTQSASGFGSFGQNAAASAANNTFGAGAFGQQQPAQPAAFGAFGQSAQQQQPQQQPSTGLFGNNSGASAFSQPKPATAFGAFGSGAFGSTANTTGAFSQPQQPQPASNIFGQAQPAAGTSNAFGAFGSTANNAAKPLFGQATAQPAQSTFGGTGLFGQNQQQNQAGQQQPQQQASLFGAGGGLFGNNGQQPQQNQQQPTTSLFGNTQATQPAAGGGLFGGGGGLFGNNNQQQQNQQQGAATTNPFGGGLFGQNKPAAPTSNAFGAFGQSTNNGTGQAQQGGGLFGSTLGQSNTQQSLGGGLFNKPAAPGLATSMSTSNTGGLFGSIGAGNSFSATATAPGAQGTLTASIAEPIGANLPIFSLLPPGPRLVNIDSQQPKKKTGFFVDVPTRSPVPRVQLGYAPANSKLRGFNSSTSGSGGNPFINSTFGSGKPGALSLAVKTPDSILGRSASPALGSGARQSVKKLILDKKVEPADLFSKSSGSPARGSQKVAFNPQLSVAAREKEAVGASPSKAATSPSAASRTQSTPTKFTASTQSRVQAEIPGQADDNVLEEGDYWCKPDLATLKKKSYTELQAFEGLVVGRKGYGEIHFLEPVDLTGLPKLGALMGEVVRFDDKECSVYPDSEDVDKPQPGSGLNVKARLILDRCWAVDKATREPIKDEKHQSTVKHIKRLRNMKDTHFESFEIADGKWTFTVDHF